MIIIDNRDRRAIYEQIVDKLSNLMFLGILEQDSKLPSVRSLATDLSINPNTIQKAYIELERQGYIYSVKGVGSFVANIDEIRNLKKEQLFKELKDFLTRAKSLISKSELIEKIDEYMI